MQTTAAAKKAVGKEWAGSFESQVEFLKNLHAVRVKQLDDLQCELDELKRSTDRTISNYQDEVRELEKLVRTFYDFDDEDECWVLKPKYCNGFIARIKRGV